MVDKRKFDRKTPSSNFLSFLGTWMLWSTFIGLIIITSLTTLLSTLTSDNHPLSTIGIIVVILILTSLVIAILSRWQRASLHAKTGRDIKHWSRWTTIAWAVGLVLALAVTHRLMIQSGYNTIAAVSIVGVGLMIIYIFIGVAQSWLLSKHIDFTWVYGFVMVMGVLFWALFVGDPRKIALGGLLAPALQGLFSGVVLMWLFHLSKLGNIAIKSKHEPLGETS